MSRIWTIVMLAAAALCVLTGREGETAAALLDSGTQAVTLMMTLLGAMTLWSGLMEILTRTGDVARLGRLFRRTMQPLFPGLTDDGAWEALSVNLAANLLGLGNAATPAGVEAAKRLSALGPVGLRALAMLLVLDNAGLQLLPTTVITLRQSAGARNPADIWGMTMLVSVIATVVGAGLMALLNAKSDRRLG